MKNRELLKADFAKSIFAVNQGKLHLLLVEDNQVQAVLLKRLLQKPNKFEIQLQLTHTATIKNTLEQLKTKPCDVVLLDLNLPDSKGIETFLSVKEEFPNLPIVIFTQFYQQEIQQALECLKLGAQDYLAKDAYLANPEVNQEMLLRSACYAIERQKVELNLKQRNSQLQIINRKLEEEIKKRQRVEEELRQSRQRLRTVITHTAEGIIVTSLGGIIRFINSTAAELLGDVEENLLNTHWDIVLEANQEQEIELKNKNRNAEPITVDMRVTTINWEGELAYLASLRDISQRKQAEIEISNALAREKELSELKSRFLSITSHEFRTPLTVISSSAAILQTFNHKLSEEKKDKHLETIQTYVTHASQLLEDILTLNRAETGKLTLIPEPVDLISFSQSLAEEIQLISPEHKIAFHASGVDSAQLVVDPKLLRQILINLLANAVKYSPAGGTVNFELAITETMANFKVEDCGIGIPPEDRQNLFDSFHRGNNVGTIRGTGLGLSIVKKCVAVHGGEISFTSEVGRGTTFNVIIPYQ